MHSLPEEKWEGGFQYKNVSSTVTKIIVSNKNLKSENNILFDTTKLLVKEEEK